MKSISYLLFPISKIQTTPDFIFYIFELTPQIKKKVLKKLKSECGKIKSLTVHSYIFRIVKFFNHPQMTIKIPRIRYTYKTSDGRLIQKTEVILPDLVLPYTNYCTRDLAALLHENHNFNESFSNGIYLSQESSDMLVDLLDCETDSQYRKKAYLKNMYPHYVTRFVDMMMNTVGNLHNFCSVSQKRLKALTQNAFFFKFQLSLFTSTSVPVPAYEYLTSENVSAVNYLGRKKNLSPNFQVSTRFQKNTFHDTG